MATPTRPLARARGSPGRPRSAPQLPRRSRVEHRGLEGVPMDVDRRVQHHRPSLLDRADRPKRSGRSPDDIHAKRREPTDVRGPIQCLTSRAGYPSDSTCRTFDMPIEVS
jgi:hypothetical protein